MADFKLSAQLSGHDADVRAVCFPAADLIISASRDRTVRVWRRQSGSPPQFEASIVSQSADFVNSLTFLRPTSNQPEGLIIAGGKDTVIEVKKPTATPQDSSERLLVGHAHNICALDVPPRGKYIVSGGWDGQARVWTTSKWETDLQLTGHDDKSVWAVLAYDDSTVVTGCADHNIRVFDLRKGAGGEAQPISTIYTPDVVRALCLVPKGHPSQADIASASNDGAIRLWKLNGQQVGELHGHESFIYSLATLPTGEIVSSGEDRTVRIWRGLDCVQTITHPAISVWSVAACSESGDIVSGASDGVVRVFTRSQERYANIETLQLHDESVKASSIPQQQMGEINKEKLPGPDFLATKSGTKEGQVQMVREDNGSISAHTWSMGQQQWINVGTVVDAVGSTGRKVEYQGKSYDYVFDVDIEDGKPALKLPYNLSVNPYEAATKFLGDNELPLTYLDQVAKFIIKNTQGATIGQTANQPTPDPRGTESSNRPGQADAPLAKKSYIPHSGFIGLLTANFPPIQKKILSINTNLIKSGQKQFALNPPEENTLSALVSVLSLAQANPSAIPPIHDYDITLLVKLTTDWAYADRLPGLDLLRIAAPSPPLAAFKHPRIGNFVDIVLEAALDTSSAPGVPVSEHMVMMAFRAIANLFFTPEGRLVAQQSVLEVFAAIERVAGVHDDAEAVGKHNRNLLIALTTVMFNYAQLAHSQAASHQAEQEIGPEMLTLMCDVLRKILREQTDSEVIYRALMALGTVVAIGGEYKEGPKSLGAETWVQNAVARASEVRVKDVGKECLDLMR